MSSYKHGFFYGGQINIGSSRTDGAIEVMPGVFLLPAPPPTYEAKDIIPVDRLDTNTFNKVFYAKYEEK